MKKILLLPAIISFLLLSSCILAEYKEENYDVSLQNNDTALGIVRHFDEEAFVHRYTFDLYEKGRKQKSYQVDVDTGEHLTFNSAWLKGQTDIEVTEDYVKITSGNWELFLELSTGAFTFTRNYGTYAPEMVLGENETGRITVLFYSGHEINLADVVLRDNAAGTLHFMYNIAGDGPFSGSSFIFDDHDRVITRSRYSCEILAEEHGWTPHPLGGADFTAYLFVDILYHEDRYYLAVCPYYDWQDYTSTAPAATNIEIRVYDIEENLLKTINTEAKDAAKTEKMYGPGWPRITINPDTSLPELTYEEVN